MEVTGGAGEEVFQVGDWVTSIYIAIKDFYWNDFVAYQIIAIKGSDAVLREHIGVWSDEVSDIVINTDQTYTVPVRSLRMSSRPYWA